MIRRSVPLALLAVAAAAVLPALAGTPMAGGGKMDSGKDIYDHKCRCHGPDLKGGGAPALNHEGKTRTFKWIVAKIENPGLYAKPSHMPPASKMGLDAGQVKTVAKFVFDHK